MEIAKRLFVPYRTRVLFLQIIALKSNRKVRQRFHMRHEFLSKSSKTFYKFMQTYRKDSYKIEAVVEHSNSSSSERTF